MSTPNFNDPATVLLPQKPPRFRARRIVVGCCLTPVVLFSVALVGAWIWWTLWNHQLNRKLADEIQRVRARGEPLTTLELNDYYQPAQGRTDMTKEILAAFEVCLSPGLRPQWIRLPLAGYPQDFGFPEVVPPVSESWGQLTEVEAFLVKQRTALATFHEVAERKGTARYPCDYSAGYNTAIEHVQDLRRAAQILSLEFHVHLHHGRPSQAIDSILAQLAMAQTLEDDPCMVSQLVRVALGRDAMKLIQRGMNEVKWSNADLIRLQTGLREFQFPSALKDVLLGERASAFTACYDPLKMAGGKYNPTPEEVRVMLTRPPQRVADAAKILEIHRGLLESSEKPWSESIRAGQKVEAEVDALGKSPTSQLTYIMTLLFVPATSYTAQSFAETAAWRDSADAAIAAELYRRKHGKRPEELVDLVPAFLPQIPNDPFTDMSMKMKLSADGLRVYSVGSDLQDNGGNLSDRMTPGSDVGVEVQVPKEP